MSERDVVVGVDGSAPSRAALRWALDQARLTGARLRAVIAWEPPAYPGWGSMGYEDFGAAAGKLLGEALHDALDPDPPADVEVVEVALPGHPAQVLIDQSAHAGLLVVGSRGHGGFAGTLLGSVSQLCAQHAHCPVVVVRGKY